MKVSSMATFDWAELRLAKTHTLMYRSGGVRWARVEGCGEVCVFRSWGVHLPPNKHVPHGVSNKERPGRPQMTHWMLQRHGAIGLCGPSY